MGKELAALFETVKAAVRAGRFPAADPALVEVVRAFLDPLRTLQKNRNFSLDVRQEICDTLSQSTGEGEKAMQSFVSYLRVSTKAQGASGLGLEAQRAAVESFAGQNGGAIVREFTEVESGKKADRPELTAALAFAKRSGAVLLVAKLDRLARNVHFLSGLMESGVDFRAADNPHANRLTIHIMAAMAEYEREAISARTKAALAQAKARGVALGSAREGHWEGREEARREGGAKGREKAAKAISEAARAEYADLLPLIRGWREEGLSLAKIADRLNQEGHKTRRGVAFTAMHIKRILDRAA
jgi:DNA invertase Pin-like site-specific DNA recombinase